MTEWLVDLALAVFIGTCVGHWFMNYAKLCELTKIEEHLTSICVHLDTISRRMIR